MLCGQFLTTNFRNPRPLHLFIHIHLVFVYTHLDTIDTFMVWVLL
jgi:hypothetical protein